MPGTTGDGLAASLAAAGLSSLRTERLMALLARAAAPFFWATAALRGSLQIATMVLHLKHWHL